MKVFISWSGERSRKIAEAIRDWLPLVIQAVKPYYSPDDTAKGTRWSNEIAKELEAATLGILCLTPENLNAPWLIFEAGALSKYLDTSRVCPILFGVEPTDIKGPLVQFQTSRFDREEMHRVVKMLNNELGSSALIPEVFESAFKMWWPRLEERIQPELVFSQESGGETRRSELDQKYQTGRLLTCDEMSEHECGPDVRRVILASADLDNDVGPNSYREIVAANLLKKVEYIYIIPNTPKMREKGKRLKEYHQEFGPPQLRIIYRPSNELEAITDTNVVAYEYADKSIAVYMELPVDVDTKRRPWACVHQAYAYTILGRLRAIYEQET